MKIYAIWHKKRVIGYCQMDKATADLLNCVAGRAGLYFGFDRTTNPEKYEQEETA